MGRRIDAGPWARLTGGLLGLFVALGCGTSHPIDPDAAAADGAVAPRDAGRPDAGPRPDSGPRDPDARPPPGAVVCGGLVCAPGEECCLLDGRCVTVGDPSCVAQELSGVPRPCARLSDCAADELCAVPDGVTGGLHCAGLVGSCRPQPDDSDCGGVSHGVCGCDGRTYEDRCDAAQAGVRVSAEAPCGTPVYDSRSMCDRPDGCGPNQRCDLSRMWCELDDPLLACGVDAQCPEGQLCCGLTGTCVPEDRPLSCQVPPEPTGEIPCTDDRDCERADGSYWGLRPSFFFCNGPGCGPGGVCERAPADCGVGGPEVCGCDGRTFVNECEAARARVRVLHTGACEAG